MTPEKTRKLVEDLNHEMGLLLKSERVLRISYERCSVLDTKRELSEDELIELDALTARCARSSDMLTSKIFGLLDALELEETGVVERCDGSAPFLS